MVLTAPVIYAVIVPFVLLDLFVSIYQRVCFPVYGIHDYLIFDRHHLAYLNALEKLNCAYCSYANGLIASVREIAGRTEQYWWGDMSHSTETVLGWLARKWRDWSRRRRTMMALDCCGPAETTRMAHDIGVSETDFRALAGRWPGSSDLLSQRMHQINLDASEIARVEPDVTRDLQRVCSLCAGQQRCRHDLASDPSAPAWREYCPNAPTFAALKSEHSKRSKAG